MSADGGELRTIIQKWCPVLSFHPKEKFFCCTPEWYTERCKLIRFLEGGKNKPTVLANSEISVNRVNEVAANKPNFQDEFRLVLNSKSSRPGQVTSQFKDIPVFCHLKRVNLADGDTLLEINYIFCFAYNGPYRVAGVNTGMHDGDWEHITVRCTTDGRLVAEPGSALASGNITLEKLPVVKDRGAAFTEPYNGVLNIVPSRPLTYEQNVRRAAADAANDGPVPVENIQVVTQGTNWLLWKVRWGTVTPPNRQRWYTDAEHPAGNTALKRTLTPCIRP